ncbi:MULTISPECIES: DUF2732 family protein [Serratia]|uniref:DUF2732 family protein n=1 Tax=Serratia TaxID=613 RepID=UPI00066768D0|nr:MULTISPECIES: DUF2732 family protein [Serratia]AVE51852.1 DUF2732 domain-containing protein [Serratia marcescens]MBH2974530.1 DUF2732 family protein [Serratia marcescens]MBH2979256.1 DUF2732 family protein [Serratia marcescens]MBN5323865.1 DUF2732 family protein [Serratia marcescens]MBN5347154.1 DUF2732 family protein [Serratia marcescens]
MPTIGQNISNRAAAASFESALNLARREAQADAAVKFSGHLDRMATAVANQELSAVEIVELLRQDAEKWKNEGLECPGYC